MEIKAAIFDLDGTVIDSMAVWDGAWERFCLKYAPVRDESLFAEYKARTLGTAIEFYKEAFAIHASPEELADEVNGYVREGYGTVEAKPGVREYLRALRARNIPACVATNTVRPLVEYVLSRLGLTEYFKFILTCTEFGSGKDRPEIFLECARRLASVPGNTAVFEDAPHALRTAKNAGFLTVAVHDPSYATSAPALRQMADRYINDFIEM